MRPRKSKTHARTRSTNSRGDALDQRAAREHTERCAEVARAAEASAAKSTLQHAIEAVPNANLNVAATWERWLEHRVLPAFHSTPVVVLPSSKGMPDVVQPRGPVLAQLGARRIEMEPASTAGEQAAKRAVRMVLRGVAPSRVALDLSRRFAQRGYLAEDVRAWLKRLALHLSPSLLDPERARGADGRLDRRKLRQLWREAYAEVGGAALRERERSSEDAKLGARNSSPRTQASKGGIPSAAASQLTGDAHGLKPPQHGADFTWVQVRGTRYEFSRGQQAELIRALWAEWERVGDGATLTSDTLRENVGSSADLFRVSKVMAGNPACGSILHSPSKGKWALYLSAPPTDAKPH